MNVKTEAQAGIAATRRFFDRTTRVLEEKDAAFRATPETLPVVHHVAHVAQTIDWFREGCLEDRWRMDFPAMHEEAARVKTLREARERLRDAWDRLVKAIDEAPEEKLAEPIAPNPIFSGRPRYHLVEGLADHCAHHRGALAVYVRLLGKVPPMVYGED